MQCWYPNRNLRSLLYVSVTIRTEQAVQDVSFSCKIYRQSQAVWDGILLDLPIVNWPDIYSKVDSIASFNVICTEVLDKRIPSLTTNFVIEIKHGSLLNVKGHTKRNKKLIIFWQRNSCKLTWDNDILYLLMYLTENKVIWNLLCPRLVFLNLIDWFSFSVPKR